MGRNGPWPSLLWRWATSTKRNARQLYRLRQCVGLRPKRSKLREASMKRAKMLQPYAGVQAFNIFVCNRFLHIASATFFKFLPLVSPHVVSNADVSILM